MPYGIVTLQPQVGRLNHMIDASSPQGIHEVSILFGGIESYLREIHKSIRGHGHQMYPWMSDSYGNGNL